MAIVVGLALGYILNAIMNGSWYVMEWTEEQRFLYVFGVFLGLILLFVMSKDKKKGDDG